MHNKNIPHNFKSDYDNHLINRRCRKSKNVDEFPVLLWPPFFTLVQFEVLLLKPAVYRHLGLVFYGQSDFKSAGFGALLVKL